VKTLPLPCPIHLEYLIAWLHGNSVRYATPGEDALWLAIKPMKGRKSGRGPCPKCQAEPLKTVDRFQRGLAEHMRVHYVPLPPAIREASGDPAVGYWLGQCFACYAVFWSDDDGKPAPEQKK
jgi:hypothetical protein